MFLKPFRVKRQNTLKGSDKKKIKNDIGKLYRLEENILSELFPAKGDMSVAKVELHSGEIAYIYSCQKNPIFFEINKKWYPSVYALWKAPEMLPVFTTWPPVFTKLAVGADLMLPGVVVSGQVHMGTFRGIKKGDLASIKLVGNRSPMAVGETLLSGEDMYLSAMKGKGVKPLHTMGDLLWEMGDQSVPPLLKDDLDIDVEDSDEEGESRKVETKSTEVNNEMADLSMGNLSINNNNDTEGATANISQSEEESDESSEEEEEEEEDPKQAMDELLNYCCLCALKGKVKKSDLPLSTGIFFKNFLQPYCPEDNYIDIKKSSYKKLSKFLQTIEAKGIIKVKTLSKGIDSIVEVDTTHEELKDLEVPEIVIPTTTSTNEDEFQSPSIADVFCVPANLLSFFKPKKYSKGQGITADEVRQGLTDYVKKNDLQLPEDKSLIKLDPILAEIVLKKTECDVVTMKWDLAKSRLFEKMQPGFQITFPGKPPIIKKGKIDPIKIDVVQRMGNKKVTLIDNVETFGIDADKFAHLIQVKRACSTTVSPSVQKNKGLQILAQGNQVDFIRQLLIEKYKLPLRFVEGLEKGSNKKKKKR